MDTSKTGLNSFTKERKLVTSELGQCSTLKDHQLLRNPSNRAQQPSLRPEFQVSTLNMPIPKQATPKQGIPKQAILKHIPKQAIPRQAILKHIPKQASPSQVMMHINNMLNIIKQDSTLQGVMYSTPPGSSLKASTLQVNILKASTQAISTLQEVILIN
jgi:hypothetical protein